MRAWKAATFALASAAFVASPFVATVPAQAEETIFMPGFVYRTGPFAPNGIPSANGLSDFYNLLNERDGGINGVRIVYEECETEYNTARGVECYERLKTRNPTIIFPYSTGITYQLIPKAPVDQIVLHSMGYGRTDASDGRVFPWVFTTPTTYWSQASAFIRYIAELEGGKENLKGKKITLVYHNSAYGREPIPTLEVLAEKHGYELQLLAVDSPGQEQRGTWLQVRRSRPDWVLLWGWGVMNQVAIQEAANIGFPMEKKIGVWWSAAEPDVRPAGEAAKGYKGGTFHAPANDLPLHRDVLTYVYDRGKGAGDRERVGEVLWNRAVVNAIMATEAIRNAQKEFDVKVPNGEQVRWGMENLHITEERWAELGLPGIGREIRNTCADHEGNGPVLIQQWDGKQWNIVSDWIEPMRDVIRPMIEESALKFAQENNITLRENCE